MAKTEQSKALQDFGRFWAGFYGTVASIAPERSALSERYWSEDWSEEPPFSLLYDALGDVFVDDFAMVRRRPPASDRLDCLVLAWQDAWLEKFVVERQGRWQCPARLDLGFGWPESRHRAPLRFALWLPGASTGGEATGSDPAREAAFYKIERLFTIALGAEAISGVSLRPHSEALIHGIDFWDCHPADLIERPDLTLLDLSAAAGRATAAIDRLFATERDALAETYLALGCREHTR